MSGAIPHFPRKLSLNRETTLSLPLTITQNPLLRESVCQNLRLYHVSIPE
jgi:hypothetical protein